MARAAIIIRAGLDGEEKRRPRFASIYLKKGYRTCELEYPGKLNQTNIVWE